VGRAHGANKNGAWQRPGREARRLAAAATPAGGRRRPGEGPRARAGRGARAPWGPGRLKGEPGGRLLSLPRPRLACAVRGGAAPQRRPPQRPRNDEGGGATARRPGPEARAAQRAAATGEQGCALPRGLGRMDWSQTGNVCRTQRRAPGRGALYARHPPPRRRPRRAARGARPRGVWGRGAGAAGGAGGRRARAAADEARPRVSRGRADHPCDHRPGMGKAPARASTSSRSCWMSCGAAAGAGKGGGRWRG
jgi:hypothetical protein